VQIGNYRRTDFGDEGGYWHADPLPLRPLQIKRLEAALDPCSTPVEAIRRMNLQPGQVKKIQRREAVCYRAKAKDARNTSFCFDRASYVLLQRKDGDEFDFFDYQPIGVKMLPARITWKHESWAPIEFRLSAVTPSSDLATYVREPGMAFSNTCADPVVPRVTDHREPEFSMEARRNYTQGSLWIAALIDESGKVTEDAILKHLPDGLDEEALRAVKLWRFKPAMCPGDKPTPYEIEVEVSFRFGT
jgi:TonB family protein